MGKTLVGVKNLETYIHHGDGRFYADETLILTPGAKDELRNRGIPLVYGRRPEAAAETPAPACPPGCTCEACLRAALSAGSGSLDALILAVAGILKHHEELREPRQLLAVSRRLIETLREHV